MDDSILGYDTRWRAEERSKGVVLSTYHTTQVQATAVSVSWKLFTVLLSPPPYFTTRHDRTIFFLHACGTQTSFKKKVTGWGSITLTSSYQFDFVLPFVISPLGDNCHLRMHKSKAQGFFVSDLLQLKLGCIYMWLWPHLYVAVPVFQQNCLCGSCYLSHLYIFRLAQLHCPLEQLLFVCCLGIHISKLLPFYFPLQYFKRHLIMTNLSLNIFQRIIHRRKTKTVKNKHRAAFILKMQQQEN